MSDRRRTAAARARRGPLRSSLASVRCFLRGLPLFVAATPKTPLRVLCVMALDTLHLLRYSQPMPRARLRQIGMLLDFAACTNAEWDHKAVCRVDYQSLRRQLEQAGLGNVIDDYLTRLGYVESRRPRIGGAQSQFDEVRAYREAVARLSLAGPVAIALDAGSVEAAIRATEDDADVAALFRMAMLCQIVDDVMDYAEDRSAGLPSFLTAVSSLPEALQMTARAVPSYGSFRESSPDSTVFPLRMGHRIVTALAALAVRMGRWRYVTSALDFSQVPRTPPRFSKQ